MDEQDLSRQFVKMGVNDIDHESHQEYEEYESHHDFENDSSEKCNLIVNYLPHDIDDISLKVNK
jgi:hypothetical protein